LPVYSFSVPGSVKASRVRDRYRMCNKRLQVIPEVKDVPDVVTPAPGELLVNGELRKLGTFGDYHQQRFALTSAKLREMGARRIVELGAHPWAMTAELIDDPSLEVCATVSAEEVTNWPDDIGVTKYQYVLQTARGNQASFVNYSANLERTLFDIDERPDTIVASEIIEHLTRSPHIMLLNINRWLSIGGKLLLTTPNGSQFSNPFRRSTPTAAYRSNIYERHSYVFTMEGLIDLIALCGFKIVESGYWEAIQRSGPSKIYGWLSQIPAAYFREKFKKTLFVVAEKDRSLDKLERCPRVYDSRGSWEYISRANTSS
jgi:predicted SAM-dependent methyltransferase